MLQEIPADHIHRALCERGYQCISLYGLLKPQATYIAVYTKSGMTLLLHAWDDGGCDLYRPLCETNSLAETIAAIPSVGVKA